MGCSVCRGHAHQVCHAPGCHDETAEVEAAMRREAERPVPPVLVCGRCHGTLYPGSNGSLICITHGIQRPAT